MGNWGDSIDEELQREEKIDFGFLFSFKTMCNYIGKIDEETSGIVNIRTVPKLTNQ